jgi:ABC-type sugar transport system permease subunit
MEAVMQQPATGDPESFSMSNVRLRSPMQRFFSGRRFLILYAVVPLIIFTLAMWFYPTFYGFYASLTRWTPISVQDNRPRFIGLRNYEKAFEPDSARRDDLEKAFANSFKYAAFYVGVGTPIALAFAILINSLRKGRGFFRLLFFLPVVTSTIAVGIIWQYLYQPQFGLFNAIFRMTKDATGFSFPLPRYMVDPKIALYCVGAMTVWHDLGYNIVIFLAGLSGIPSDYYEAAAIDGAGRWDIFRRITLPLLQPTLLLITVTGLAGALQVFDAVYVLVPTGFGGEGPAKSTLTFVMLLYQQAFPYGATYEFGYASALGVIIFVTILVISLLQLWIGRRRWEY